MVEKALGLSSRPDPELSGVPGVLIMNENGPRHWIFRSVLRKKGSSMQEVRYRRYEVGLHPEPEVTPGS